MKSLLIVLIGVFVLAGTVTAVQAQGQEASAPFAVQIVGGTCETPGAVSASLNSLKVLPGDRVGSDDALSVESSYSVVAVPMADLLAGDVAIEVRDVASGSIIACGEIGGVLDDNGALSIGLPAFAESGFTGIAYMAPVPGNPGQTGVSVFVAKTGQPEGAPSGVAGSSPASGTDASEVPSYADLARRHVTLLTGSLVRVDALFDAPQVGERAWVDQVYAELTLWQILYDAAGELTPPAELVAFHADYLAALTLLDSAAEDIFHGLETGDAALLVRAGEQIDEAIAAIVALAE